MRLAWQCGEPHADALLERLTPEQAAEVEAFAATEPLNQARDNLRAAMVALITARSAGAKGIHLDDLLESLEPWDSEKAREQTREEMDIQMMKVVGLFNAADRARTNGN